MRELRTSGSVGAPGWKQPGATRPCFGDLRDGSAGRVGEFRDAFVGHPDAVAAFVHKPVMVAAEQDEVVYFCFAAVSPVDYVMSIDVFVCRAARKAAAAVPSLQRAPDRRRNAASLAPDIQCRAVFALVPVDNAAIARHPAGRFRGKCARPSLEEGNI